MARVSADDGPCHVVHASLVRRRRWLPVMNESSMGRDRPRGPQKNERSKDEEENENIITNFMNGPSTQCVCVCARLRVLERKKVFGEQKHGHFA